ncbi:MAG: hypothetical protein F4X81_01575 [Gammaproteobacteria bacterium]|nr:hypothetical protein [Gammaproteobacteria bacterium]
MAPAQIDGGCRIRHVGGGHHHVAEPGAPGAGEHGVEVVAELPIEQVGADVNQFKVVHRGATAMSTPGSIGVSSPKRAA